MRRRGQLWIGIIGGEGLDLQRFRLEPGCRRCHGWLRSWPSKRRIPSLRGRREDRLTQRGWIDAEVAAAVADRDVWHVTNGEY